jgi:hypothetical protein
MTPEDEEFERISREIRRNAAEDDDIQDYKKPWVSLTDDEREQIINANTATGLWHMAKDIERKLKEKNF